MSEEILKKLEFNMTRYKENDAKLKEIEKEQDILKIENIAILKSLNLKSHTAGNYQIQLINTKRKKIGVDELMLISIIGAERVNALKIVPIDAILNGIKDKTMPEIAENAIITVAMPTYTQIKTLNQKKTNETVNLNE